LQIMTAAHVRRQWARVRWQAIRLDGPVHLKVERICHLAQRATCRSIGRRRCQRTPGPALALEEIVIDLRIAFTGLDALRFGNLNPRMMFMQAGPGGVCITTC
jgi:hypothetical protein